MSRFIGLSILGQSPSFASCLLCSGPKLFFFFFLIFFSWMANLSLAQSSYIICEPGLSWDKKIKFEPSIWFLVWVEPEHSSPCSHFPIDTPSYGLPYTWSNHLNQFSILSSLVDTPKFSLISSFFIISFFFFLFTLIYLSVLILAKSKSMTGIIVVL